MTNWEGLSPPYRTIVADPPWKVNRPNGWGKEATSSSYLYLPYSTMGVEEIKALSVNELVGDVTAHLYLWTTNRYVEAAYDVARAWGFAPASLLTWIKEPRGMGPGGHYVTTTEFVLFARNGTENRNPEVRHPSSWFNLPRGRHSEKPAGFIDVVERISPAPYVELFARQPRLGWDSWGWGFEASA